MLVFNPPFKTFCNIFSAKKVLKNLFFVSMKALIFFKFMSFEHLQKMKKDCLILYNKLILSTNTAFKFYNNCVRKSYRLIFSYWTNIHFTMVCCAFIRFVYIVLKKKDFSISTLKVFN